MPTRSRAHELETESQRAFATSMPSAVVIREVSEDYGIDREVELFEQGRTTGLTFKVQLKSTDGDGSSVRLNREHLEYWRSLDVPVLIVMYEARTGTLRARWAHSVPLGDAETGPATLAVPMTTTPPLGPGWADTLPDELRVLRAMRRGIVPAPTPVRVTTDAAWVGIQPSVLAVSLLNLSRRTRTRMRLARDPDPASESVSEAENAEGGEASGEAADAGDVVATRPEDTAGDAHWGTATEPAVAVRFDDDRVSVTFPAGYTSCSLAMPAQIRDAIGIDGQDPVELVQLALGLAAAAALPIDPSVSLDWLGALAPDAIWWAWPELAERFGDILTDGRGIGLLLDVHACLLEVGSETADAYLLALTASIRSATSEEFDAYVARIEKALPPGPQAGRHLFNLANLAHERRQWGQAADLYVQVPEHAPAYRRDALYLRRRGAAQWEAERFVEAAESYLGAVERGFSTHELLPLAADSLLWAGQFARAATVIAPWVPDGTHRDRVGVLNKIVIDTVKSVTGLDTQDRRDYDSAAIIGRYRAARDAGTLNRDTLIGLLREADALHPLCWAHLADLPDAGFPTSLTCAMLLVEQPGAWVQTLLLALIDQVEEELVHCIVDQARFYCGQAFYDAVWDNATEQPPEAAQLLRHIITAAYSAEEFPEDLHLRAIDLSRVQIVLDAAAVPAPARRNGPIPDR